VQLRVVRESRRRVRWGVVLTENRVEQTLFLGGEVGNRRIRNMMRLVLSLILLAPLVARAQTASCGSGSGVCVPATCAESDVLAVINKAYGGTAELGAVPGDTVSLPECKKRSDIALSSISRSSVGVVTATLASDITTDYAVGGFVSVYKVTGDINFNGYFQLASASGNTLTWNQKGSAVSGTVTGKTGPASVVGCSSPNTCWPQTATIIGAINVKGQNPPSASSPSVIGSQGGDNTVLYDAVNKLNCKDAPMLFMKPSTTTGWTVSNFTVYGASYDSGMCAEYLKIGGFSEAFRVTNLTFLNASASASILTVDSALGVIDHCSFTGVRSRGILVKHLQWGHVPNGDGSWAEPNLMGTGQAVFVENDDFSGLDQTTGGINDVAAESGGRVVVRHDKISTIGSHGTESVGRQRSVRTIVAYDNIVSNGTQTNGVNAIVSYRGGTGLVYDNIATAMNCGKCSQVLTRSTSYSAYRAGDARVPWGAGSPKDPGPGLTGSAKNACDGEGKYDHNTDAPPAPPYVHGIATAASTSGGLTDANTNLFEAITGGPAGVAYTVINTTTCPTFGPHCWGAIIKTMPTKVSPNVLTATPSTESNQQHQWSAGDTYEIRGVMQCIDQPGAGTSVLVSPDNIPMPNAWVENGLEPIYSWNNTTNGKFIPAGANPIAGGSPGNEVIKANRDYYDQNMTWTPGAPCESGVCVGALLQRPAQCTPLVGYAATDENTLYQCSSKDTWTRYYKPYVYPHPLDKAIEAVSCSRKQPAASK